MKKKITLLTAIVCITFQSILIAQSTDPWKITASKIDPSNYYGITVANGQIGIVSSAEVFKVKEVVLAGAYDLYGRGRVSNFLKSFNLLNMNLKIDDKKLDNTNTSNIKQELDMQHASFTTSFDYKDIAAVSYTCYALRHLPYSVLMDITITAKKNILIGCESVMEAPDALKEVQNYYNEIDRPHTTISLLTSSAKSPTGKLLMCASNAFIFSEAHGNEPRVIHEMWDNNMHLAKFSKKNECG